MYSRLSITIQPQANPNLGTRELESTHINEKSLDTTVAVKNSHPTYHQCACELEHGQLSLIEPRSSRNLIIRLIRRFLLPAIFVMVFVTLTGFLPGWEVELMGRALEKREVRVPREGQLAPVICTCLISI